MLLALQECVRWLEGIGLSLADVRTVLWKLPSLSERRAMCMKGMQLAGPTGSTPWHVSPA